MVFIHRKTYLIKRDLQTKLIMRFVIIATVWSAAAASFFVLMAERSLEEMLYSSHIHVKTSVELLMPSTLQAHVISLLLFAGLLSYTIAAVWKRVSAPIYSLKKDIARIAGGDLAVDVTLRENEEFQDLAMELDDMRKELRRKFILLKEKQLELSDAVSGLDRSILKGDPSSRHAAALRETVAGMKEALNEFTY